MSDQQAQPLNKKQVDILDGIPQVSQQAFAQMAFGQQVVGPLEKEWVGDDASDFGKIFNAIYAHASSMCQEAELWRHRARQWEERARKLGYCE